MKKNKMFFYFKLGETLMKNILKEMKHSLFS